MPLGPQAITSPTLQLLIFIDTRVLLTRAMLQHSLLSF